MLITKHIAQKYRETLIAGSQLGVSLKESLAGMDWKTATGSVGTSHSIATLTFHIGYYLQAVVSVLQDEPLTLHDRLSFDHKPIQNEADWTALKAHVWLQAERCIELISAMPAERLDEAFADPKYGSVYRNISGIMEHAIYHLGQIEWLKKHGQELVALSKAEATAAGSDDPETIEGDPLQLNTQRCIIRSMRLTDIPAFHAYRSKPEVAQFQGYDPMSLEEAQAFVERQIDVPFGRAGQWVQYAIEDRKTGTLLGDCAIRLHADDVRIASVGMTIAPAFQRQGVGREVLAAILAFLFDTQACHRIEETTDEGNTASRRLLEGLGFRQEGRFLENNFSKGQWVTELQYALLKREWQSRKSEK